MLCSASDKGKLFPENFSENSNLDDSGISLPIFPSRTDLKLHNISATPKMVKKVMTNFDLSKASGRDCIEVVVLNKCEPELSVVITELFDKCVKESCFRDCWKVSSVSLYLRSLGKGVQLKTTDHYSSAIPPLLNNLEVLCSASDKAKLFPENFSENSNLDDSGISLPVFPSRTVLKLNNISATPKMMKKVMTNFDL